ncbi:MAG: precorrin-2 C(20)-methyltransferase [Nitrospirota bacterium]
MKERYGLLYGVGIGPGDPELVTLKALKIIQNVPVIYVPKRSQRDNSFALSIVKDMIDLKRQKICELLFPMTNNTEELKRYWEIAADNIYDRLSSGYNSAFITEGDPFLYSTFVHLYKTFQKRYTSIEIRVIPGISSITASSCRALFPLTESEDKIAILPARYHIEELRETIDRFDTVVLLKVNSVMDDLLKIIKDIGLSDNIIFVQRCGTSEELILRDINSIRDKKPDYFSLIIIKKEGGDYV